MLFFQLGIAVVVFADNDGKFAAGITEYGCVVHALNAFQQEGTPGTSSIC